MIDITMLSRIYFIRRLNESFVDDIYELCKGNPQFYQYSEAPLRKEQILSDLYLTPPGIGLEDKYFLGFYKNDVLVAVMDLVDGYPEKDICFIGFFNGMEYTRFVMVQGIICAFCVRVPVSFLMSKWEPVSLFHIGLATPCSTVLQIILCFGCLIYLKKHLAERSRQEL